MARYSVFCLLLLLCNLPASLWSQTDSVATDTVREPESIKVYLVSLRVPSPDSVDFAYLGRFDLQALEFNVPSEDSLNNLADIGLGEDDLEGPDCFIPELKVVYYKTTYIFSFYCSAVRKYKNSAPFVASSVRVKNDIPFSYTTSEYLASLRKKYMNYPQVTEEYAQPFIHTDTLDSTTEADINALEAAIRDDDEGLPDDDEQEFISTDDPGDGTIPDSQPDDSQPGPDEPAPLDEDEDPTATPPPGDDGGN